MVVTCATAYQLYSSSMSKPGDYARLAVSNGALDYKYNDIIRLHNKQYASNSHLSLAKQFQKGIRTLRKVSIIMFRLRILASAEDVITAS
jgi:hypothetical protein